jgi:hypothetical protein
VYTGTSGDARRHSKTYQKMNGAGGYCWNIRMADGRRFLAATGSSPHTFISTSYRPLLSKYTPL